METANFGTLLREARERRCLSLAEIAKKTKLSQSSLKMLEQGNLDDLPPDVFVRGFIRSYARTVGIRDAEPLGLFEQMLDDRRRAELALLQTPMVQPIGDDPTATPTPAPPEEDAPKRGIGLAVFVIIVLLIATITLSLFLRQPPQSGEGLSLESGSPRSSVLGPRAGPS